VATRWYQRVIRRYQRNRQKVPKVYSGGTNGAIRRFKRVIRRFQKWQPEDTKAEVLRYQNVNLKLSKR
jgi:hypothetical protein